MTDSTRTTRLGTWAATTALAATAATLAATVLAAPATAATPHTVTPSSAGTSRVQRTTALGRLALAGRFGLHGVPAAGSSAALGPREMPVTGVFGPSSFWTQPVVGAPVAANSAAMVNDLVGHITDRYNGNAAFNAHQFTTSFYTATATTARVNMTYDDCQGKGYEPAGFAAQLAGVPIPANAQPAQGTDHELAVWSPATDQLWEFWEATKTATGWSACWGGRIDHVSTSAGIFPSGFGASASGVATSGGTLGLAETRAGVVDHAIGLVIPDTAMWNIFSWPANRSDGGDRDANAIPIGTRLRLDPSIDVDAIPGLTPIARIVAHTAQTYGFVVVDSAGAVSITGESGVADQQATGVDPWSVLEHGKPDYDIFGGFPWSHLQVLPKDYGKPAS